MINADWLVNDGLNSTNPQSCTNNKDTTWTYNQGVILGGLADLAVIQKNSAMIAIGEKIIDATIQHLIQNTSKGAVLLDKCEVDAQGKQKDCGADGSQFKGIFMRYLSYFCESNKASAAKYKAFAASQAAIILSQNSHSTSDSLQFGLHFAGPFDKADCSRQSSALDAILADLRLRIA
jgi:predicted alpha-1,6-mannanase (GH76 family)